jgi:serine O-acetyltransferase
MKHNMEKSASAKVDRFCNGKEVDHASLWQKIREEAAAIALREPQMASLLRDVVIDQPCLGAALGCRLARKLAREDMSRDELAPLLAGLFQQHPSLTCSAAKDLIAIYERDPACDSPLQPLLFFKGFLAICTYRISHHLWHHNRRDLALYFQSLASEVFAVDIHPAARIGCGILLDHATSFVVGETAIIEDDVSILHEVTLDAGEHVRLARGHLGVHRLGDEAGLRQLLLEHLEGRRLKAKLVNLVCADAKKG